MNDDGLIPFADQVRQNGRAVATATAALLDRAFVLQDALLLRWDIEAVLHRLRAQAGAMAGEEGYLDALRAAESLRDEALALLAELRERG